MIGTGETASVNDSYGLRLIEQGKAVAIPKASKPAGSAEKKAPPKDRADA